MHVQSPPRKSRHRLRTALKQVLWFAQSNRYDVVYLTTFPEQNTLIDLLIMDSCLPIPQTPESWCTKRRYPASVCSHGCRSLFDAARFNYPRFCTGPQVEAYGIQSKAYHEVLFPEIAVVARRIYSLWAWRGPHRKHHPKVYLCRAPAWIDQPGAIVVL